ncbi:MAG: hypothetical protein RLZZ385_1316 [Pseudomonadota bacterium]|jgi:hypothetical protein
MTLIPERPLIISPTLAATIGLEEAVLFHVITELLHHQPGQIRQGYKWVDISDAQLAAALPFWRTADIQRVSASLIALGLLLRDPATNTADSYRYAINETVARSGAEAPVTAPPEAAARTRSEGLRMGGSPAAERQEGASYMDPRWEPGSEWIAQCRQHAIPEDFIRDRIPEFVQYWRDRGSAEFSWGNKFYKHVLREWRHEQSRQGAWEMAQPMSGAWRPSEDALEILHNAGVSRAFIEDAVPEFVLYWRERGETHGAWNTRFIEHIRRQWSRYASAIGNDDVPRPIPDNWQPSAECYDILQLAEIDEDYARSKVPEFVLYWKDSGQARASWNTVFLQFIKQDWAQRLKTYNLSQGNAETRSLAEESQRRIEARLQRFSDRSWAE